MIASRSGCANSCAAAICTARTWASTFIAWIISPKPPGPSRSRALDDRLDAQFSRSRSSRGERRSGNGAAGAAAGALHRAHRRLDVHVDAHGAVVFADVHVVAAGAAGNR